MAAGLAAAAALAALALGAAAPAAAAAVPAPATYGGGLDGIGALSGHSKVYLIFYGNQWGARGGADGVATFTGDRYHAAEAAQNLFKGIGTNGEQWSSTLTQYCDGAVPVGATTCPAGTTSIPYQSNGVLAGIWYDNAAPSPADASFATLEEETVRAAQVFGNTTPSANRYAVYVLLSPSGTNPDGYLVDPATRATRFCAEHSWVDSPYGHLFFDNQPYNMDGAGCGQNLVNPAPSGTLDGYTMTLGHEWAETMTDPMWTASAGGWRAGGSGSEIADVCNANPPRTPTGANNVSLATGTFVLPALWSNDTGTCTISHPILAPARPADQVSTTVRVFRDAALGKCLGVDPAAAVQGGAAAVLVDCGDPRYLQRWAEIRVTYQGRPARSFRMLRSDGLSTGCLDVANASTSTGAAVVAGPCNGSVSQIWYVGPSGGVADQNSRLQLDTSYAGTVAGTAIVQGRPRLISGTSTLVPTEQWTIDAAG